MKKFINFRKTIAMLLAMLIFASGFSIVTASAASIFINNSGSYEYIVPSGATIIF